MLLHSIVIPVFNEIKGLEELYKRVLGVINSGSEQFEVILVNDGSRDGSDAALDQLQVRDKRFKIIHFSRNFGHQIAISAGIAHAAGDTVTVIDADLQDPPELILEFIKKWKSGYEVVYGLRVTRRGESIFKLWTAKIFYRMIRSITSLDIPIDTGDFRLMDRKVVEAFLKISERHRYIRGLVSWIGFRQTGVPYDRDVRAHGETHYPFHKMLKLAFDGVASFSFVPLRLATWFAVFLLALGFFALTALLGASILTTWSVSAWSIFIVAGVFVCAIQFLILGIIGEYLGRMLDEVRQRPLYLISRVQGFDPLQKTLNSSQHSEAA